MTRLPTLGSRGEGWVAGQMVLLAAIGLGALAGPAWFDVARLAGIAIGGALALVGLWLAARGVFDLGASLTPYPAPSGGSNLVETGVYARIRHPIYAGLISGCVGWALVWASPVSLAMIVALTAWLDAKARREEAWLVAAYPGYAAYRARTRRFVPGLY